MSLPDRIQMVFAAVGLFACNVTGRVGSNAVPDGWSNGDLVDGGPIDALDPSIFDVVNEPTLDVASSDACSEATCSTDGASCPTGTTACGGACVNLTSDPRNCGACGNACASGITCSIGVCGSSGCPAGTTRCSGGGAFVCADLTTDARNCGACGVACSSGRTCTGGVCN